MSGTTRTRPPFSRKTSATWAIFPYTYAVFGAMGDKDIAGIVTQLKGEIDHWNVTASADPARGIDGDA